MVDATRETEDRTEANRRSVMRKIGGSALGGIGMLTGSVSGATEPFAKDDDEIRTEELTSREKGQLRGKVLSASGFKTIRRQARALDFRPKLGEVEALRVINEETGEDRLQLKIPCEDVSSENRTRGAVLFGCYNDEEVRARCISQTKGEPIYIQECEVPAEDRSDSVGNEEVTVLEIPTNERGDDQ